MTTVKQDILDLRAKGKTYEEIRELTGASKGNISYHCVKAGLGLGKGNHQKHYDWNLIQEFYDLGNSRKACTMEFGFQSLAWDKAIARGDIIPRPRRGLEDVNPLSRRQIKKMLLRDGLPYKCSICGIHEWEGMPLSLQLDHIDGNTHNGDRDNLRLLCPNCHSQTETFSGRNKSYKKNISR